MAKEQSLEISTNRNNDEKKKENITYPTYSN